MFLISFIIALFLAYIFLKLGIGIIKIIAWLFLFGIVALFAAYLLIPILAIVFAGAVLFAVLR